MQRWLSDHWTGNYPKRLQTIRAEAQRIGLSIVQGYEISGIYEEIQSPKLAEHEFRRAETWSIGAADNIKCLTQLLNSSALCTQVDYTDIQNCHLV